MKRIFTIITALITLSLVGIILVQVSWLQNMILLREEQVKEKVTKATTRMGAELGQYKGTYLGAKTPTPNLFSEDFSFDAFKPTTVGKRFTVEELTEKIKKQFQKVDLPKMRFEFAIISIGSRASGNLGQQVERVSSNFEQAYGDSVRNYPAGTPILSPSGSDAENLTLDETLYIVALDYKSTVIKSLRWPIAIAILFSIIIIAAFYLTVRTMLRQKKLGEIKNDFINNMTHEFKTPIATISLAVDAMKNEKVLQDREKLGYFSNIIKEENKRMNRQVETILKASQLEKQEVDLNLKPVHIHKIIKDVVENFALQLQDKGGKAELLLNASDDMVEADEVHISNLVNNLFDNALKYSKDNTAPLVKLTTLSNGKRFSMKIEDNGIGMNRETVKRVFERFYRAHTGNIHNVKGFGLGLSYVKTIVEAHHGEVKVDSTLGKGSTFIIELPLKKS